MFEIVGKVCVCIFLATFVLVGLAFGAGWITVAFLPVLAFVIPILIVVVLIYKVIKA